MQLIDFVQAGRYAALAEEEDEAEAVPDPAVTARTAMERLPDAAPAGYVAVAYAEQKWRERETQFEQQLAHLQALVAAQSAEGASAASEGAPSVADDVASIDDLAGDDEKWSQVSRAKRKALLRRERDALAGRIRTSLGKVSPIASPFVKK